MTVLSLALYIYCILFIIGVIYVLYQAHVQDKCERRTCDEYVQEMNNRYLRALKKEKEKL